MSSYTVFEIEKLTHQPIEIKDIRNIAREIDDNFKYDEGII